MKIDSVELHPEGSDFVAVLSFKDPTRQNPYNVKSISGLDAEAIIPRYYGTATNSNKKFYNLSQQKRDFVMLVDLNPQFSAGKSYSDLRDDLYRMLASSRTGLIEIQFKEAGVVVAAISGLATKLEATHFEKNPQVQLTVSAEDGALRAPAPVNVNVAGLNLADVNIVDALSTAPHAFDFTLTFTGALASINISDPTDASWSFVVTPAGGFLVGDVLHFSSEPKDKKLYVVRGAATIYLADKIVSGSVWPILFPGDNHFGAVSPASMVINAISYYPTYWGV